MTKNVISIHDLIVEFKGERILDSFSLDLARSEKVVLTGHSGCGKSTVLKSILGFVDIARGSIYVDGLLVDAVSCWEVRRKVAYVGQEAFSGTGSAMEFIEAPFSFKHNSHLKKNMERLPGLMDQFKLDKSMLQKTADELSGGEKQRFAVITALLLDRDILLLDEPSASLDKTGRQRFADFIRSTNLTVLAVAHDDETIAAADRVVTLERCIK